MQSLKRKYNPRDDWRALKRSYSGAYYKSVVHAATSITRNEMYATISYLSNSLAHLDEFSMDS